MSYDLFFNDKNNQLTHKRFTDYFHDREHYTLESDNQAWYENEDTGVYFSFEFNEPDAGNDLPEGEQDLSVASFNINYFRPSFFIQEAKQEVMAFISAFELDVEDPQLHEDDNFPTDRFTDAQIVSGWTSGNTFAYRSILTTDFENNRTKTREEIQTDLENYTIASKDYLDTAWQWNKQRNIVQDSVADDVFVPKIMFLEYQGQFVSAVAWPDGIPSYIPKVDILLVGRNELAKRKWFTKKEDMGIARWSDVEELFKKHQTLNKTDGYYFYYQQPPKDMVKVIQSLPEASFDDLTGISPGDILEKDIIENVLANL